MSDITMIIAYALGLVMSEQHPDYYGTYMGDLDTTPLTEEWDDVTWEPMSPVHKPHWLRTHVA